VSDTTTPTLQDALGRVDDAISRDVRPRGPLSLAQVVAHCAQSLECAVNGYPQPRSWLVRRLVGPMVARRFLSRGRMRHDVGAPIPGLPVPDTDDVHAARERLAAAIQRFSAHEGTHPEHFAFGRLDHDEAARLQALHLLDHLSPE
jgi:hypothetical protein